MMLLFSLKPVRRRHPCIVSINLLLAVRRHIDSKFFESLCHFLSVAASGRSASRGLAFKGIEILSDEGLLWFFELSGLIRSGGRCVWRHRG